MLRWFAHFLKGEDNGVEKETQPALLRHGSGWRGWARRAMSGERRRTGRCPLRRLPIFSPQPRTAKEVWAPRTPKSAKASTTYRSDPAHPASLPPVRAFPGARDARDYEKHAEPQTFTTEPLSEAVEWTGAVARGTACFFVGQGHGTSSFA